ncbi:MAG TPA: hypothetical protein VFO77_06040 [Actinoplanes sp.]|nr:hypothetical protein [Actinoplanes sp.]
MKRALRIGLPAAATALAVAGAVALAPSASAATEYQATLAITLTKGDSVTLRTNGGYTCYTGFIAKDPNKPSVVSKDISVSVRPGQYIAIASLHSCYMNLAFAGVTVTSNGQRAELTLGPPPASL